jgi:hypothetical protein
METEPPTVRGRAFPGRRFLPPFLLMLAGKTAYLAAAGVSYEMDTATYLNYAVPYHHPPLYSLFLLGLESLYPSVLLVASVQVLLFSAAAALFVLRFGGPAWRGAVVAGLLALEPVTSFFCSNLMSEGLFVPLLLAWTVLADVYLERAREGRPLSGAAIALGGVTALLYATRLPATICLPFVLVMLLWRTRDLRRTVLQALLLVVIVQACLLPVKLAYLQRYGSFSVTLFTGTALWNSASVLYPDSSVRQQPRSEFERFLAARDTGEFTIHAALMTDAIHDPRYAYDQFVRTRRFDVDQALEFERSLARTALRIIVESPLDYLIRVVAPNFLQPLRADEEIVISDEMTRLMQRRFDYRQAEDVRYRSWTWRIYLGLLFLVTAVHAARGRGDRQVTLLVLFCWYYAVALPVLAIVFLRYLIVLAPLIVMAGWRVAAPRLD